MFKACFGQQQKELLAAIAAEAVYIPNIGRNRQCERSQNLIACRMTMAIIDVLEMVEINDGDGERTAGPVCPSDFLVQFIKDTANRTERR